MNKKFNESELEEIMNEIETLEKEFNCQEDDASHSNDVLRRLTEMTVEEATARHQNVHDFPVKKDTAVSFKVSGQMNLNLNIEISGKEVKIFVDETNGLIVELEDGMKFQIPVHSNQSNKKVA